LGLYMGRDGNKGVGEGRKESVEAEERRPLRLPDDFAERETGIIPQDPRGLNAEVDPYLAREMARAGRGPIASLEGRRPAAPASASSRPAANRSMAAKASQEPYKNPQRGPSFEEISAYNRSRQTAGTSTKPREGMIQASTRSMAPARPQTREEAIAQIPTSTGSRYSSVASDTDPSLLETGSEFGRNVGNTFAALTPLGGGFGKVGAELATAKGAAERAAKSRELAQEAIRTQKPTKFTSTKSTAPKRTSEATKSRVKKFNEEEAGVEFKRGGSAKVKKMASGGFTSSASSRADGIASRGKTKCKMY
jgi:hypothetical protein